MLVKEEEEKEIKISHIVIQIKITPLYTESLLRGIV